MSAPKRNRFNRQGNQPKKTNNQKQPISPRAKPYAWLCMIVLLFLVLAGAVYYQLEFRVYLITAASSAFALLTTYINQKPEERSMTKLLIPICAVAVPLLASHSYEKYNELKSIPEFRIETKRSNETVNVSLNVNKGRISRWAIDNPVQGKITGIIDQNSETDVNTIRKRITGNADDMSLNNAEISIKDIQLNKNIQYAINYNFTPLPYNIPAPINEFVNVFLNERDKYKITYTWIYKGNEYSKTEWRYIKNDQITEEPRFDTRDVRKFDRPFADDEVKQLTREGMKKRVVE
jgi:hypothetical protein